MSEHELLFQNIAMLPDIQKTKEASSITQHVPLAADLSNSFIILSGIWRQLPWDLPSYHRAFHVS
jgi:hypothetical protein